LLSNIKHKGLQSTTNTCFTKQPVYKHVHKHLLHKAASL
jgi:hypothetical protein